MKTRTFLIAILALGATVLALTPDTGFSQGVPPSGAYAVNTLTLPVSTLAAGASTNLAQGWSSIVSVTNTSTTWNSSSNAFVSVTNVVSATNTIYADLPNIMQKDLGIIALQTAGVGTNTLTFGRFLNSSVVDTNNTFTLTVGQTAAGGQGNSTNLPATYLGGFGGVRLLSISWNSTAGWTNAGISYAVKRNAY